MRQLDRARAGRRGGGELVDAAGHRLVDGGRLQARRNASDAARVGTARCRQRANRAKRCVWGSSRACFCGGQFGALAGGLHSVRRARARLFCEGRILAVASSIGG